MSIPLAISSADLGVLALGLVIAAVVGGLVAGVLEIGGGIVVVPVLYHVLATLGLDQSVRMHVAVGTSLAAGIPAALYSSQDPLRSAGVSALRGLVAPALGGVALGSWLMASSSGQVLAILFAIGAALVVLVVLLGPSRRTHLLPVPRLVRGLVVPASVGAVAALTGMGGRTAALPASMLCGGATELRREGSVIVAALVAMAAALGAALAGWRANGLPPESLGYINLLGFALIAPILLLMEPAAAALSHWLDLKRLRFVFSALIVISTARMLWDAFG